MLGDRLLRVAHHAFVLLVVLASTIALSAQTVVDPRYVELTPSADHGALSSNGTPLVERYTLTLYVGSSVAFDTMDLGKPAPSGGVIRVDFLPFLNTVPTPGVVFEARVTAIGPGGSAASAASNGFSFQSMCARTLTSTGQSVGSAATTGSLGVTAGTGCTWSAVSNENWITLTGATSRTGKTTQSWISVSGSGTASGSAAYIVQPNTTGGSRMGLVSIGTQVFTINQSSGGGTAPVVPAGLRIVVVGGGSD